ncbi:MULTISPECIES: hypothetical protein [Providencia]|uniref:hypothetical protein n=1 Tax=Providencia TaxID=586 RepID=UPI0011219210|nr:MULTISPECIES: hypothetical protein [Providencia]EIL1983453.1 hypothetical protein [Providencia rettgeri]EIU9514247.1 hypothetical protein [Providencia rettgeri]EJD6670139.1 hypothetical protein [Providencia rettgeri]ELR5093768.1 hypothetical protein [Providencia rettgeri]ELR5224330.1 hypothetical protein [Providencia rettgeri]
MSKENSIDTPKRRYAKYLIKRVTLIFTVILIFAGIDYGVNSTVVGLPKCSSNEVMGVLHKILPAGTFIKNPQQYDSDVFGATRYCRVTLDDQIRSFKVTWYSDNKDTFIVSFI